MAVLHGSGGPYLPRTMLGEQYCSSGDDGWSKASSRPPFNFVPLRRWGVVPNAVSAEPERRVAIINDQGHEIGNVPVYSKPSYKNPAKHGEVPRNVGARVHPDWLVHNAVLQAGHRLLHDAKAPAASRPPGKSGRKRQDAQRAIKDIPTRTTTFQSGSEVRIESALHSALLTFLWSYPPLNGEYPKPLPATSPIRNIAPGTVQ